MAYFKGKGAAVAQFAQEWIVQTKGRWAGEPLHIEPWQQDFLDELFLVDEHGNYVYREALVGVARKNGKSTLTAAIALYALLVEGESGPEVYAAAAAEEQARVVFKQAKDFIEASPRLRDWLKPQRSVILCPHNGGVFRVLSSDAPLQYGLNPSCVVIDELWAHANPELYWALTTGQLARENPIIVSITTAGFDRESICWDVYRRGRDLADQGKDAMRKAQFLHRWFEAPAGCDIRDPEAIAAANPSSWIKEEDLLREADRLPEFVFRRLHLNQWTAIEDAWIGEQEWDACQGEPFLDPDETCYAAVDVGVVRDSSAIVLGQWHDEELHIGQLIMLPEDHPELGVADVREACGDLAMEMSGLKELNYDPWAFRESAEILSERGIPMVEFPQTNSRMAPASENLYEMVKEQRIVHDGDPTLKDQILSAVAAPTDRSWRISKRKSRKRIDACIALAMMADRAMEGKTKPRRRERSLKVF